MTYPTAYGTDVVPLLKKLKFEPRFAPAMAQVFGKTLICRSLEVATKVAAEVSLNCVTMEGDQVERRGALRGGWNDERRSRMDAIREIKVRWEGGLGRLSGGVDEWVDTWVCCIFPGGWEGKGVCVFGVLWPTHKGCLPTRAACLPRRGRAEATRGRVRRAAGLVVGARRSKLPPSSSSPTLKPTLNPRSGCRRCATSLPSCGARPRRSRLGWRRCSRPSPPRPPTWPRRRRRRSTCSERGGRGGGGVG